MKIQVGHGPLLPLIRKLITVVFYKLRNEQKTSNITTHTAVVLSPDKISNEKLFHIKFILLRDYVAIILLFKKF